MKTEPVTIYIDKEIGLTGANPRQVTVQKSDNLADWTNLAQITMPSGTRLFLTDATDAHSRFYRISK